MARPKMDEFNELICGKYICAKKNASIKINAKKVKTIFKSKVRKFSKSGAYIPTSQNYKNHEVFVVVMEERK